MLDVKIGALGEGIAAAGGLANGDGKRRVEQPFRRCSDSAGVIDGKSLSR
jgi:hypothetical protein